MMKRSLALLVLVALVLTVPVSARRATITLVTAKYSGAPANDNTITGIGGSAGDVAAVIAGTVNNANDITISDNSGHTWSTCPSGNIENTGETAVRLVTGYTTLTTSISTITLTSSGAGSTYGAVVVYGGMGTVTCDASGTAQDDATTTHGSAISVSPSTTNDTVLFGAVAGTTIFTVNTPPSGYAEVGTTLDRFWAGHKVVNSTSANGFVTVTAASRTTVSVLMALKSTVTYTGGCGRLSLLGAGC
jgi:hypothetical protein